MILKFCLPVNNFSLFLNTFLGVHSSLITPMKGFRKLGNGVLSRFRDSCRCESKIRILCALICRSNQAEKRRVNTAKQFKLKNHLCLNWSWKPLNMTEVQHRLPNAQSTCSYAALLETARNNHHNLAPTTLIAIYHPKFTHLPAWCSSRCFSPQGGTFIIQSIRERQYKDNTKAKGKVYVICVLQHIKKHDVSV